MKSSKKNLSIDHLTAWMEGRKELAPVISLFDIQLVAFEAGEATLEMQPKPHCHNTSGIVQGGVYCVLADVAMGTAIITSINPEEQFTTTELSINYFRPVVDSKLIAKAHVVRLGKRIVYVECSIIDEADNLITKVKSSCLRFT